MFVVTAAAATVVNGAGATAIGDCTDGDCGIIATETVIGFVLGFVLTTNCCVGDAIHGCIGLL